jgi:hypothetical protein
VSPIIVEPEDLAGAGVSIASVSDDLVAALSTLAAGLPDGAMAGHDTAGLAFGMAYKQAGQALLDAGAAAANGGRKVGFGVQMSATNYSRADALSTIGGGTGALPPPSAPAEVDAPSMSSSSGGGVAEPFLWSMVEMLVGGVWPDGDPAQLRAAAGAWSTFARTLSGTGTELQGPSATIAGQQIPEGDAMTTALSDLRKGLTDVATESVKLATQTFEFAADVESAQNAIRDLLSRLSPSGIFDGLGAIFSGDAMEELREIADDIRTVLDNLKRQADARQASMDDVMQMIDGAVVSLEQRARKEFTDYLGDDVGNAVATTFDTSLNLREGLLKGGVGALQDLQQLNPLRFAYDFEGAKDTWGKMLETNFNASLVGHVIDPQRAAETQLQMLKGLVHAEDWTTARPGLGAGENMFDLGSAFLGGAGAARSGTRAAGEAADAAEGAASGVRAVGALDNAVTETSGIAGRVEGIADELGKVGDDVPSGATPNPAGPAVPHNLTDPPSAPSVPDAPARVSHSHTPHVPDSTLIDRSSTVPHSSAPTGAPAGIPTGAGHANPPTHSGADAYPSHPQHGSDPTPSEPIQPRHPESHGTGGGDLPHPDRDRSVHPNHESDSGNEDSNHTDSPNGPHSTNDSPDGEDKPDDQPDNRPLDEIPPPLVRDTPYPEMGGINPNYIGEQYPGGPMGYPGVTYLDDEMRESYRITIHGGVVYDADGLPFDTRDGVSAFGAGNGGRAIYVMDEHGNLYASLEHEYRRFHHSSFFDGGDVAAAGEMMVRDGKIMELTDRSGHYLPGRSQTQQVLDQLESQGIIIDPKHIHLFAPPGT